ncbi:putative mitochondrial protein AtMg00310 [Apium graveolens]|uniref:putative mitochondrial protein AtMg00310 n=1 Tax=Apium graveolens TaxID=4045 RepID=UPI003D79B254
MVKNVGQSIPTYNMSCFLMAKTLCTKIERMLNGYWWGSTGNNSKGIRWAAWEKMALPKCKGGLGFRDLYGFNLALLGKYVWNFYSRPNSPVTRLFKARYFPRKSILHAAKGVGPNFVWTGIWEAKEQLKNGFCWVLGDGESIRIYKDPWLKGKRDFCVEDSHMNGGRNERVSCYFHPESKVWDVQKVHQNFHANDIDLILQTRIPRNMANDRIAWTTSTTGLYTVKTVYQHWSSHNFVRTEVAEVTVGRS